MPRAADHITSDAMRFIIAGALNTGLSTLVYFLCLLAISPGWAYTAAWLVGLIFVTIFYPDRVFVGGDNSLQGRFMLAGVIVAVYLVGLLILKGMMSMTGEARIAFVVTLVATTILNFVLGRTLLRRERR